MFSLPVVLAELEVRLQATIRDIDKNEILQDDILRSLAFPQMQDRESEVSQPASDTHEWIFDDSSRSNFLSWLADTDEEIYWINGKPGCGKSTLMRFISTHRITTRKLKEWANGRAILSASYYFWVSGTKDQKSQVGLLRSLLHQLLTQVPDAMPYTVPEIWLERWAMTSIERVKNPVDWSLDSLQLALERFIGRTLRTMKVVLFVDGLDEFDGDHERIVSLFTGLVEASAKAIKLCLSSRSYSVFEAAFQHKPQFKLQEFTAADISNYISKELSQQFLGTQDTREAIIQKADGVFLWAQLAVRFLKQNAKSIEDVTQLVHNLPGDLDQLFMWLIFERADSNAMELAKTHSLLRAREEVTLFTGDQTSAIVTLYDMALQNVSDVVDDTESASAQIDNKDLALFLQAYLTQLHQSSQGMMVHHSKVAANERTGPSMRGVDDDYIAEEQLARGKVTYIHRTVRDWCYRADIAVKLSKCIPGDWLPHLSHLAICRASRRYSLVPVRKARSINEIWPFVVLSLTHARYAERELRQRQLSAGSPSYAAYLRYVTSINTLQTQYWARKSFGRDKEVDDSWCSHALGSYEERRRMVGYLYTFWAAGGEVPLLAHAVEFLVSRKSTKYPQSDEEFVRGLLEAGASYRQEFIHDRRAVTPWIVALENLQQGDRRGWIEQDTGTNEDDNDTDRKQDRSDWVGIVNAFLEHGAGLDVKTPGWQKDASMAARDILEMLRKKYHVDGLKLA